MKNRIHDALKICQVNWQACQEQWQGQTPGNRGTQSLQVLWQMPGDGWVTEEENKIKNPKALLLGFLFTVILTKGINYDFIISSFGHIRPFFNHDFSA